MIKHLPVVIFIFSSFSSVFSQSGAGVEKDANGYYLQQEKSTPKINIEVYPNPAVENIFVKIENGELEKIEFELFNIIGTAVKVDFEEIEKNYYRIGVKELTAGYYLLMVKDPVKRFNQAFKIHKVNK